MEVYEELYYRLFNRMTDLIEQLQVAQAEAEELFLRWPEGEQPTGEVLPPALRQRPALSGGMAKEKERILQEATQACQKTETVVVGKDLP